jgi:hypothetical protein
MSETGTDDRPAPPPRRPQRIAERWIGLFLLGFVCFMPPIVGIFSKPATLFGIPLLYWWLFAVWGALILLAARTAERGRRRARKEE